ncbi:MAG: hypothetical protein AMXMBFR4_32670 [Candidatus Hydrogenedentota bacterium]
MTLSHSAMNSADLPDSFFRAYLSAIEQSIHSAKHYTRHVMNNARIAIGIRSPELTKKALDIAERIGMDADHGETGCRTLPRIFGRLCNTEGEGAHPAGVCRARPVSPHFSPVAPDDGSDW